MSDVHQELAVYLKRLMKTLEQLGHGHAEIYDTDVREQLFDAVLLSFIKPQAGYELPDSYGLSDEQGNQSVKAALERYVTAAKSYAEQIGLNAPLDRLAVFQNPEVFTDDEQQYPDDFFGWMDPADFVE